MKAEGVDDPWAHLTFTNEAAGSNLSTEVIRDVAPLDVQLGVDDVKAVPEKLLKALFSQSEKSSFQHEEFRGGNENLPPMRTYAVVDAAKVQNLPDMIEASGLTYRCLFKGKAYDELMEAAPWLVELEEGNAFTRNLFTRSNAQWHLWGAEPGIYVRSRSTFEKVWSHFRKLTKIQDVHGNWFYFRFWEAGGLNALFQSWVDAPNQLAAFFVMPEGLGVDSVICVDANTGTVRSHYISNKLINFRNSPFRLSDEDRKVLSRWRAGRFDSKLLAEFSRTYPEFSSSSEDGNIKWLSYVIKSASESGIELESAIVDFAHAAYLLQGDPRAHGETVSFLGDQTLHQKDRALLARKAAEKFVAIRGSK